MNSRHPRAQVTSKAWLFSKVLAISGLLGFGLVACPPQPPVTAFFVSNKGCAPPNSVDPAACSANPAPPVCADTGSGQIWCNADSKCQYRVVANNPSCPCIAGETKGCSTTDGRTGQQTCASANGTSTTWGACTANAICSDNVCANDTSFKPCVNGGFGAPQACAPGTTCVGAGRCVASVPTPECGPGTQKCEGATLFACENDKWANKGVQAGSCGAICQPNASSDRCGPGGLEKCRDDGQWSSQQCNCKCLLNCVTMGVPCQVRCSCHP